jgi:hypothetical protein
MRQRPSTLGANEERGAVGRRLGDHCLNSRDERERVEPSRVGHAGEPVRVTTMRTEAHVESVWKTGRGQCEGTDGLSCKASPGPSGLDGLSQAGQVRAMKKKSRGT